MRIPIAAEAYDQSNEQQTRRSIEVAVGNIERRLSSLLTKSGTLAAGVEEITLVNGANNDVSIGYATYVRISGPSAAFSISGFSGADQGRVLVLRNTTTQDVTITNEGASSTAAYRILTQSGADVVLKGSTGGTTMIFLYDSTSLRWIMVGEEVAAHVFDTVYVASGGAVNFNSGDVTITHSADLLTVAGGSFKFAAGTTSIAPTLLQSGTNLTSATAGATEYNGKAQMFTPLGTQRGVVPSEQTFRLDANLAGSDATGAQNIFGVGCTLSSSTVYSFRISGALEKSAGTTSHTIAIGFGGTATINNIGWGAVMTAAPVAAGTTAAASMNFRGVVTSTVLTSAITTAGVRFIFEVWGTVSINAGGTFIPQYTLSAAPGGAYSTNAGSIMTIYPLAASGANVNVGTWA